MTFLQSCDNHKRGADPIKKSDGWCLWYKDYNNDRYCAFSKTIPPEKKLNYAKCNKDEEISAICYGTLTLDRRR